MPGAGIWLALRAAGNDTDFVAIKVTFQNAGVVTSFSSSPTAKHAYVYTPGPDKLLSAVAQVDGPDLEFLSHVCTGPSEATTTTEQVATTVPDVTTTTEPVAVLPTDVEQNTTTGVDSSTSTTAQPSALSPRNEPNAPVSPANTSRGNRPTTVRSGTLARTGSDTAPLVAAGMGLLLLGSALVLRGRSFAR